MASSESLFPSRSHLLSQAICCRRPVTWEALASPLLCRSARKFPSLRLLPVPLPSPTPATPPSPSPFPPIAPSVGTRFLYPSTPPPLFFSFSLPPLSPCYARPASSLSTHPATSSPLSLLSLSLPSLLSSCPSSSSLLLFVLSLSPLSLLSVCPSSLSLSEPSLSPDLHPDLPSSPALPATSSPTPFPLRTMSGRLSVCLCLAAASSSSSGFGFDSDKAYLDCK
ncbi:hypothetical protein ACLOJK_039089 [Asimina triloba]